MLEPIFVQNIMISWNCDQKFWSINIRTHTWKEKRNEFRINPKPRLGHFLIQARRRAEGNYFVGSDLNELRPILTTRENWKIF